MKLYGRITTDTGKIICKGANGFIKFELLNERREVVATYRADSKEDRLITLQEWVKENEKLLKLY